MGKTLKEGGRELRLKALEAVKERISSLYGDEAKVIASELDGQELDAATALLTHFGEHQNTCVGEFFFKPVAGDPDKGQYYISLITLSSDFPVKNVPALAFAISILNFYIEAGCFVLNKPTDLLAFRSTRTFPGDTPEETLIRDCVLQTEEAYEIAAKYCTPVLSLAEGSMNVTEFVKMIKTEL